MIIIDMNQIALANLMMNLNMNKSKEVDEDTVVQLSLKELRVKIEQLSPHIQIQKVYRLLDKYRHQMTAFLEYRQTNTVTMHVPPKIFDYERNTVTR